MTNIKEDYINSSLEIYSIEASSKRFKSENISYNVFQNCTAPLFATKVNIM